MSEVNLYLVQLGADSNVINPDPGSASRHVHTVGYEGYIPSDSGVLFDQIDTTSGPTVDRVEAS